MPNKEVCAKCEFWKPDNLVVTPMGIPGVKKSKNASNQYGKCHVSFQGNSELKVWDLGTLGSTKCAAVDDNDHPLFTPKTQGKISTTG